jgi:hypothetical protein
MKVASSFPALSFLRWLAKKAKDLWYRLFGALFCFSASGIYICPVVKVSLKRTCDELYSEGPIRTLCLISDADPMNTNLFVQWLRHFQNYVKATETDPVLLASDNHISYCCLKQKRVYRDIHTYSQIIQSITPGQLQFLAPEILLHTRMWHIYC